MKANSLSGKRTLVIAATLVLVLSVGLPVAAQAAMSAVSPAAAAAPSSSANTGVAASANTQTAVAPASVPVSPHPGIIDDYEATGAATTVDPSVAYYTVDYEPIFNVYETLVNYNGTSTSTFVPTLATCVPGTPQCTTDYGNDLIGEVAGQPVYWTFVIDPAAHYYDPSTGASWQVYPDDVMFSIARTLAFMDLPGFAYQPGWIIGQALLPIGNPKWDGGMHFPYNNTPYDVMSSMLINDSNFCTATMEDGVHGNGCITFVASGSGGESWPQFLEFVADNLGASAEPCGWFSYVGAGVPGWSGTHAANGDGSCLLPGNAKSTQDSGFQAYLASVAQGSNTPGEPGTGQYSWDAFENLSYNTPSIQPTVNDTMVGSGPYWGSIDLATGYGLRASPGYEQPSACGGNPADFAQYVGYCDPAADPSSCLTSYSSAACAYIPEVNTFYSTTDTNGISACEAGTADFCEIEVAHTATLLSLQAEGKLNIFEASSLALFQFNYVDTFDGGLFNSSGLSGHNNIPDDFFGYEAARQLMTMSYPFSTIENTIWTTDGIQFGFETGGPIPQQMGCYYAPTTTNGCTNTYTVEWPYLFNGGNVQTNPSVKGSAAWWYGQAKNPASPLYDKQIAKCSKSSPCIFTIEGVTGDPSLDAAISDWIGEIEVVTNGTVQPQSYDLTGSTLLVDCAEAAPLADPCAVFNYGWLPDYPDPTDYVAAYEEPDGTYTGPAAVSETLNLPQFKTCTEAGFTGHSADTFANLQFWAAQANASAIPTDCQGVAYDVDTGAGLNVSAPLLPGTQRILLYDLTQTIFNYLSEDVWFEGQNGIFSAAPWINTESVNTNVMVGLGDVGVFFQNKYVTQEGTVTFKETGLPKGTEWGVHVGTSLVNSYTTSATLNLEPGTYTFSLSPVLGYYLGTAKDHSITVTAGKTLTEKVKFISIGSTVKFTEKGLPKGTAWAVSAGGFSANGTKSSLTLRLGNGTYAFTAGQVPTNSTSPITPFPGFTSNSGGTFTVTAPKGQTVKVVFSPYHGYSAKFTPSGIPNGTAWKLSLKLVKGTGLLAPKPSSMKEDTNTSVVWTGLANGTYDYTVTAKHFAKITGSFTISGSNASVSLTFVASAHNTVVLAPLSSLQPVHVEAAVAPRSRALA